MAFRRPAVRPRSAPLDGGESVDALGAVKSLERFLDDITTSIDRFLDGLAREVEVFLVEDTEGRVSNQQPFYLVRQRGNAKIIVVNVGTKDQRRVTVELVDDILVVASPQRRLKFRVGKDVVPETIESTMKDELVTIIIPRPQARKIEIKSA